VLHKILVISGVALATGLALAQQRPQVKVNVLNVCSPSAEEQKEIGAALAKIPAKPAFSPDFEVARGRSSLSDQSPLLQAGPAAQMAPGPILSDWVRIRHDLTDQSAFSTVQYSFSTDAKSMIETLVLHVHDPKELVQVSIEDNASAVTSAASMLATNTPVDRIKLERFGKSSIVLARCSGSEGGPVPDQSAYEPLFRQASDVMGRYRHLLGVRYSVPEELAKVAATTRARGAVRRRPVANTSSPKK
jgi:hypothetical protein